MIKPSATSTSNSYRDDDSVLSNDFSVGDESLGSTTSHSEVTRDTLGTHESNEVKKLATRETRNVRAWRAVVVVVLVLTGVAVTTATYLFLSREQNDYYRASYHIFSHTVEDASKYHVQNMQQALEGLSETLTASAPANSWPFFTLPMFEVQGHQLRIQSGIEVFGVAPRVSQAQRAAWLNYSQTHQGWMLESREIVQASDETYQPTSYKNESISADFFRLDGVSPPVGPHFPMWQLSPPPFSPRFVNYNLNGTAWLGEMLPTLEVSRDALFTNVYDLSILSGLGVSSTDHLAFHMFGGNNLSVDEAYTHPHSVVVKPVFRVLGDDKGDMVAIIAGVVPWDRYLTNLLPEGVNGIMCVLVNTCGQAFSYILDGPIPTYLGEGDQHDPAFDDTKTVIPLYEDVDSNGTTSPAECKYSFVVYGTQTYQSSLGSDTAIVFTAVVAATFALVVITFCVYDCFVQRRNSKVVDAATRSNAILSSLFPSNVRDRLFAETTKEAPSAQAAGHSLVPKSRLRNFLDEGDGPKEEHGEELGYGGTPIADLFPDTTVLFADIAGFTAWSSVREPAQVFTLLETLYRAFDEIARQRRVFKVETIGDCYVAVTGLPDPRKDHAVAMARFARACLLKMKSLTKRLETSLGPDTGDLEMRAGIHSGPVTAGVLRGERSRFQLFGDTMNTASRMESTGERGRIHVSQETADLLIASGKREWISRREDKVVAKGKGEMQTFWLNLQVGAKTVANSSSRDSSEESNQDSLDEDIVRAAEASFSSRTRRLIEWNVDVLLRLLKQIVARRNLLLEKNPRRKPDANEKAFELTNNKSIDEVQEIITLPEENFQFVAKIADTVELKPAVVEQLYDYVSNIAALYQDNPFHNFDHASHVAMSVTKLLSRIVAPTEHDDEHGRTLHDHTYGITSDPLTQFSCILAALIHDADHPGVPNAQLVKEETILSQHYDGKSVAEQNSLDLAWNLLMDDTYNDLRETIYTTHRGLTRFRHLLVNSVMATDIVDKELKSLRNARWAKAFSETANDGSSRDSVNRKATIVIEHLIQASDVAHTMQHWHIYRKWNERFFLECYRAYKDGRAEKNPADGWYEGEIGFFDFYIIPLARKLKDCGVFGVSSDEYLNYAEKNRKEWEERGREVVDEMIELVNQAETGKGTENSNLDLLLGTESFENVKR